MYLNVFMAKINKIVLCATLWGLEVDPDSWKLSNLSGKVLHGQ